MEGKKGEYDIAGSHRSDPTHFEHAQVAGAWDYLGVNTEADGKSYPVMYRFIMHKVDIYAGTEVWSTALLGCTHVHRIPGEHATMDYLTESRHLWARLLEEEVGALLDLFHELGMLVSE